MLSTEGLEVDLELTTHRRTQAVEELTEVWATKVVLQVARVGVIGDVKDSNADAHPAILEHRETEAFGDLHVK